MDKRLFMVHVNILYGAIFGLEKLLRLAQD